MSVRKTLVELEELSSEQTSEMSSNQFHKDDLLLQPNSCFKIILNVKLVFSKLKSALGGCGHNMQVFVYENTNVEFVCPLCDILNMEEENARDDKQTVENDSDANERLLMSDDEEDVEVIDYQSRTADELFEEDGSSIMNMLYPDIKIQDNDDDEDRKTIHKAKDDLNEIHILTMDEENARDDEQTVKNDDDANERLLMSDNDEEEVEIIEYESRTADEFLETDVEIIDYQTQTADELLEEDESNIMNMLYPDVEIQDIDDDDEDRKTIGKAKDDLNKNEILLKKSINQNGVIFNQDKLELLKASGAISVTMSEENVAIDMTALKKKSKMKMAKVPLLVDENLPKGWKRKVVERKSGNGIGQYVKIYGEGRVFYKKKVLKKFVEDNNLTSIDPESVDFSVFGRSKQ